MKRITAGRDTIPRVAEGFGADRIVPAWGTDSSGEQDGRRAIGFRLHLRSFGR